MPRHWLTPCLMISLLLAFPSRPALASGAREEPILLTNEDVKRLRPQPGEPNGKADPTSRLVIVPSARVGPPAAVATEGRAQATSPDPSPDPPAFRGPASSWQEEYYRLKALALRRTIERGDPIDFGDVEAAREANTRAKPSRFDFDTPRACLYDARDALIHAPNGQPCRPNRRDRNATTPRSNRVRHESCLYGTRGELLYSPAGQDCSR